MAKPMNPDPRENPTHDIVPPADINVGRKRFADFELKGKVFVITGGARGLGLTLAEAVVEAGGKGEFRYYYLSSRKTGRPVVHLLLKVVLS